LISGNVSKLTLGKFPQAVSAYQACPAKLNHQNNYGSEVDSKTSILLWIQFYCILREWPVPPPHGRTDDYAPATSSVLRARAAKNHDFRCGLSPAVLCAVYGRLVSEELTFAA